MPLPPGEAGDVGRPVIVSGGNELRGSPCLRRLLPMTATTFARLLSDAAVSARRQQQTGRVRRPILFRT